MQYSSTGRVLLNFCCHRVRIETQRSFWSFQACGEGLAAGQVMAVGGVVKADDFCTLARLPAKTHANSTFVGKRVFPLRYEQGFVSVVEGESHEVHRFHKQAYLCRSCEVAPCKTACLRQGQKGTRPGSLLHGAWLFASDLPLLWRLGHLHCCRSGSVR